MAAIISRRAPLAKLLENLMARTVAPPPSLSALRSYSANAKKREKDEDDERSRRRQASDPFNLTRSILVEEMADTLFPSSARRSWDAKENKDAHHRSGEGDGAQGGGGGD